MKKIKALVAITAILAVTMTTVAFAAPSHTAGVVTIVVPGSTSASTAEVKVPTQEALTAAVGEAHSTSSESLRRMGENGIRLVEERYSVRSVAERMKRLYEWGLGRTQRPGFVFECGTRLEK